MRVLGPTASTLRFHHLGVATKSLRIDADAYSQLGYATEGDEFIDRTQGVRGLFLVGGGPRLELLEPLPDSDTLAPLLRRGVKCYHHAYEVASLDDSLVRLQRARARLIRPPTPAVAFGEREVAFLMLPNMWIVELIAGQR
jgi:Glyoxalase/Bleomycin resistance protein/Dioxygenase superfamily